MRQGFVSVDRNSLMGGVVVGIQVVPWGCHWTHWTGGAQDWYQ